MSQMKAQCECGRNHYQLTGTPLCRFVCHCQVCQSYTGRPCSDVLVYRPRDVRVDDISHTDYKRWRKPPNIRRGSCRHCGKPVIEYGPLDLLVFVPTPNVQNQEALPPADLHIFYHRRHGKANDSVPKLSGYFRSNIGLLKLIAQRMRRGL
jgi:hypothetical protein